jgi:hypothetical protein
VTDTQDDGALEKAGLVFIRRLILAQLDRNVLSYRNPALSEVIDDICADPITAPGYLSMCASVLSCLAARMMDNKEIRSVPQLYAWAPPIAAAQRLIALWVDGRSDDLGAALNDIESQGLLTSTVAAVNGMVAVLLINRHGGDRAAAAQEAADLLAAQLDGTLSGPPQF